MASIVDIYNCNIPLLLQIETNLKECQHGELQCQVQKNVKKLTRSLPVWQLRTDPGTVD